MTSFVDQGKGHKPQTLTHSQNEGKDEAQIPANAKARLAGWILVWFYLTAVICTWDATFIMLRPYSLPGGSLASLWYLYKYYVTVDQRYMDIGDAFVFAQSLLNYAEVVFNIVTIYMHYQRSRHTPTLAFMVSVMTMWKTVLYFLMFTEFCTGGAYRAGNTATQEFFLVVIPNIIWIIVPLCVMHSLWQQLTPDDTRSEPATGDDAGFHDKGLVGNGHSLKEKAVGNGSVSGTAVINGTANASGTITRRHVK